MVLSNPGPISVGRKGHSRALLPRHRYITTINLTNVRASTAVQEAEEAPSLPVVASSQA